MRHILLGLATWFFTIATAHAGEVIEIHDRLPPAVKPAPQHFNPKRVPPYSDRAFLSDAWSRAWLLLDVDASGNVTQFKFLKRPGYDLEPIATAEAFKLHFEPGRDASGNAVAAYVIWAIEWPSHGWLAMINNDTTTGLPDDVGLPPYRHSPADTVPCYGSGPLSLGSAHPVYRDCSRPDLSRAEHERWITRPRR